MADILSSLILPSSSQESFHSAYADQSINMSSSPSSQTEAQPMNNHALCAQTGGHLPIHDVNAYLNDPANRALLDTKPMKNLPGNDLSKSSNSTTQPPNGSDPSPMQLGAPESSLNLSRLYELCQAKGFTPEFTIEEDPNRGQTFTGKLCIGSETIVAQGEKDRWNSKKEAKQALALKGLDVVKSLEPRVKRIDEDVRGENWIGKLQGTSLQSRRHRSSTLLINLKLPTLLS